MPNEFDQDSELFNPDQPTDQPGELVTVNLGKFKLSRVGAEAEFTEVVTCEGTPLTTFVTKKYPYQPKPELLESLNALIPHLILLCEQYNGDHLDTPNQVMDEWHKAHLFTVTGLVYKETGCMLLGRRTLRGKKVLNMTTPFILWDEEEAAEEPYAFSYSLRHSIDIAAQLALAYIDGDYLREASQLSIDFDNPTSTDE